MGSGTLRLLLLLVFSADVASAHGEGPSVLHRTAAPRLERLDPAGVVRLHEEEREGQELHEEGHELAGHAREGHEREGHEREGHEREGEGAEEEEEGAEGEGEGEGEGEEVHYSEADFEVACMLLGSVISVMVVLYLVNWNDDDIRRYTWKVLSTTISIFLAVLLFQGFNELLLRMLRGSSHVLVCVWSFVHSLVYIALLQVSIAYISGTLWGKAGGQGLDTEVWVINDPLSKDNEVTVPEEKVRNKSAHRSACEDDYGMEVPVMKITKELHLRKRSMKCYARLLAHMAGFAAINSGATMQQLEVFKSRPIMALMPLVITQSTIMVVFKCFGVLRHRLRHAFEGEGENHHVKMYSEEVFEAENDISALSSSYLVVQVVRFGISGILPNVEGLEEVKMHETNLEVGLLFMDGLLFGCMSVALVVSLVLSGQGECEEEEEEPDTVGGRILIIAMNSTAMAFAWCVFFGGRWLAKSHGMDMESVMGRVVLALSVSALSCLAVFGLDKVDDNLVRHGGEKQDAAGAAIQMIINALGILIGFSWERCFEGGVEAVASTTNHPVMVKCIMGFIIAGAVTPMWMRHILNKEMALQELKSDRKKHQAHQEALMGENGTNGHSA